VTLPPLTPPAPTPIAAPPFTIAGPPASTPIAAPAPPQPEHEREPHVSASSALHCPKLGFEDDPGQSFGRPTRLHRCFAASTPLPLSLDQQRELCLSDQFGMCPRLASDSQSAQSAVASPPPAPRPRTPLRKAQPPRA